MWTEESPGKIRACVIAKASDEFGLNLTQNPMELLEHPELVAVLFPVLYHSFGVCCCMYRSPAPQQTRL